MTLLLALSLAHAGEIQVVASQAVSIEVDGKMLSPRAGERGATATGLAGGAHRVQVFERDRLLAAATVDVGVTEQVRLDLQRGQLVELGRGALAGAATSAAPCPAPSAPAPGSIQITGIDPANVAVWVDGKQLKYASGSFVASNVSAGMHDVRVAKGSSTLFSGEMRVYPELVRRCAPVGSALECAHMEAMVSVAPVPVASAPPAPPPPSGPKAVSDKDFASITAAVQGQSFSSDKMGVLTTASKDRYFTIAQVGALMDLFTMGDDKVAAARLVAKRVVDPENAYQLESHLTFSSNKEEVRALFAR